MDPRSAAALAGVHPDLAKVMIAAMARASFIIIHGKRTEAEEAAMVAKGASQTMHSRHLPNTKGFACAVDVAALKDGHVSWDPALYKAIWAEVQPLAHALNIPVEWGGTWRAFRDFGHFQLPWAQYP